MRHRILITFGVLAFALAGHAQTPQLEEAKGVDVRVQSFHWHPKGLALLYTRSEDKGTGVGVYRPGDEEGDIVLHLGPKDSYEMQWFDSRASGVVIVYRSIDNEKGNQNEATIYMVDAGARKARKLWSMMSEPGKRVDVDVDTSPSMQHAIFRIKVGETMRHLILPSTSSDLVFSTDLDRAISEGYAGPAWSIDGTAVYVKGAAETPAFWATKESKDVLESRSLTLELALKEDIVASGVLLKLLARRTAPPVGTPVLELIPSNGAVRLVPSRGPWVEPESPSAPLSLQTKLTRLEYQGVRDATETLWLVLGDPEQGHSTLVSPKAAKPALSPVNNAIAYLVDGVLFVRKIKF